jgi:predicted XRE-type DNA-binding protein
MPDANPTITDSSGNVFADMGLPDPEERLIKSQLAYAITQLIEARGLTQTRAAELLGVDQPRISELSRGRLKGFSIEHLFRYLNILGQDIEISLRPVSGEERPTVRLRAGTPEAASANSG